MDAIARPPSNPDTRISPIHSSLQHTNRQDDPGFLVADKTNCVALNNILIIDENGSRSEPDDNLYGRSERSSFPWCTTLTTSHTMICPSNDSYLSSLYRWIHPIRLQQPNLDCDIHGDFGPRS
mmetsp:Transcript_34343/g.50972  ORF Transcript_34343/g.50972 Transcript_34343/m.50972 type:complete len:123 (+) Transcript_34343:114-482(+)